MLLKVKDTHPKFGLAVQQLFPSISAGLDPCKKPMKEISIHNKLIFQESKTEGLLPWISLFQLDVI